MMNTYSDFLNQNTLSGGVAPLRHDLARDRYLQKRRAQRQLSRPSFGVAKFLSAISGFFAAIAERSTANAIVRHANRKTQIA